eukprot:COSAG01_NODE_8428_length_2787_cov_11.770089_1_plen_46_part_00
MIHTLYCYSSLALHCVGATKSPQASSGSQKETAYDDAPSLCDTTP